MIVFNPIPAINIGIGHISTHGLLIAVGFVIAAVLARREAKKCRLSVDLVDNAVIIAVIAGLIGARIFYIVALGQGMTSLEMLEVWTGGLSSHGGYLFGIAAGLGYLYWKKADVLAYADAIFPYLLMGWAIGRIGCFLNWDSYGAITTSPLAVVVNGEARYPTQLFEIAGYLISFFVTVIFSRSRKNDSRLKGVKAAMALGLFALTRFVVDFFRGDPPQYLLLSRVVTVAVMLACISFILYRNKFEA